MHSGEKVEFPMIWKESGFKVLARRTENCTHFITIVQEGETNLEFQLEMCSATRKRILKYLKEIGVYFSDIKFSPWVVFIWHCLSRSAMSLRTQALAVSPFCQS